MGTAFKLSDKDVVNRNDKNRVEDQYFDKDFNIVSKSEAQRSYTISSAASLLPELTALIVMCIASGKQEKTLGGVLLSAPKENINLTAKTRISAHADGSILFHAGEPNADYIK
ncbi:MAG: hypothetical protein LIO38_03385, partial [Cloacibacillus sp.]|nr:hypothetical protein [Cloacibacillus sp.]